MRRRGYSYLLVFSLVGLAFGFAQAFAQANKSKASARSPSSLTQGPWMKTDRTGTKVQVTLPGPREAAGLNNPRSPASRARATGTVSGGANPSQVFPAGAGGNAW